MVYLAILPVLMPILGASPLAFLRKSSVEARKGEGRPTLARHFSSGRRAGLALWALLAAAVALLEGLFVLLAREALADSAAPWAPGAPPAGAWAAGTDARAMGSLAGAPAALAGMAAVALLRALLQTAQGRLEIAASARWLAGRRAVLLGVLKHCSYPIYRPAAARALARDLVEGLERCANGIGAHLRCLGAALHLAAFAPLLVWLSWKGALLAVAFGLPAAALSRFKAARLSLAGRAWNRARDGMAREEEGWAESLETLAGNGELAAQGARLQARLQELRGAGWRWESQRVLFPHVMELCLFLLLAALISLAAALDSRLGGAAELLPFAFLLLLLYRPVREWARHYPAYALGQKSWQSHLSLMRRLEKAGPPVPPAVSAGGELEVRGLHFAYADGSRRKAVFDGLDLSLGAGEVTLLLGPNGSGKSTLLRLLAGVERPDRGAIRYPRAMLRGDRLHICYLPQRPILAGHMLAALRGPADGGSPRRFFLEETLGLSPLLARLLEVPDPVDAGRRLSGGERQRLRLGWAFSSDAAFLLLDEPTTGLPGGERDALMARLLSWWREGGRGRGMLMVSHEPALARICDRAVRLDGAGALPAAAEPAGGSRGNG